MFVTYNNSAAHIFTKLILQIEQRFAHSMNKNGIHFNDIYQFIYLENSQECV